MVGALIHPHSHEQGLQALVGMTGLTVTIEKCLAWCQSVSPDALLDFVQEVSALSKAAAANEQCYIQSKRAVADLHERLKQSQQLVDACACTDGSSVVKMEHLQDRLTAARYAICLLNNM